MKQLFALTFLIFSSLSAFSAVAADAKQCQKLYSEQKHYDALPVCEKAAEANNAVAQYITGLMYYQGSGALQDLNQAFTWTQRSAYNGYRAAQYNLGLFYANGQGTREDFVKAYAWLTLAAEAGFTDAGDALEQLKQDLSYRELNAGNKEVDKLRTQVKQ